MSYVILVVVPCHRSYHQSLFMGWKHHLLLMEKHGPMKHLSFALPPPKVIASFQIVWIVSNYSKGQGCRILSSKFQWNCARVDERSQILFILPKCLWFLKETNLAEIFFQALKIITCLYQYQWIVDSPPTEIIWCSKMNQKQTIGKSDCITKVSKTMDFNENNMSPTLCKKPKNCLQKYCRNSAEFPFPFSPYPVYLAWG